MITKIGFAFSDDAVKQTDSKEVQMPRYKLCKFYQKFQVIILDHCLNGEGYP